MAIDWKEIGDIMKNYVIWVLSLVVLAVLPAWAQVDGVELEPAETGDESVDYSEDVDHVHGSVFPLVKYHREGDETKLKVPYLPLVSLVKAKKSDDVEEVSVVSVPFFKLVKSEKHSDGRFDHQFVKLPIIGSLFRHKRTADKEKIRFLIFSHTRYLDEDDGAPRSATKGARRSSHHRGKGSFDRK